MDVLLKIKYSLADILRELGLRKPSQPVEDILVLQMKDKFFNGGGCEERSSPASAHKRRARNISICSNDNVPKEQL